MFKRAAIALLLGTISNITFARLPAPRWVQGKNYFAIRNTQPHARSGDVVVTEVFSFACIACNQFQPFVDKLETELPPGAVLKFLPAAFGSTEDWPVFQRAYFTAKALRLDNQRTHDAMFRAIWAPGGPLAIYDMTSLTPKPRPDMPAIANIAKFYAGFGAKPDEFIATSDSPAISTEMKRADTQIITWGINAVPTIVVDAKWRTDTLSAPGEEGLVNLTLYLVKKELATRHAKSPPVR